VSPAGDTGTLGNQRRRAVFLDRDGTIIEDTGFVSHPNQVRLLPGAGPAIARLNAGGALVIVVTNQSGIARGLFSEEDYRRTERRLDQLLGESGAHIDGYFFCPHLPEVNGPCECRKPGTLLYRQAAEQFAIDLRRSWWVGDRARDVLPAGAFGARGILVLGESGVAQATGATITHRVVEVSDLAQAVEVILRES
jgi:D-glycero-D-manno-heptose 1,7-bisphosphate phosphatase